MLARLIQGYGKSTPALESATEEQHTRSLLWRSQAVDYGRGSSPPATPVGSPTFRVGPFDDRGGLELSESRDVRIIVAQDSFGPMDRPLVLFDSHKQNPTESKPTSPRPASVFASPESKRPGSQSNPTWSMHARNQSATMSPTSAAWSRPSREVEGGDAVNRLLDSMFGVTNSTRTESSTKMHVLPSKAGRSESNPTLPPFTPTMRAPMRRSRTSMQTVSSQTLGSSTKDETSMKDDVILVTRTFVVALPETRDRADDPTTPVPNENESPTASRVDIARDADIATGKKTKLVEKRIPMFAVGVLLTLPPEDQRLNISRPPSRSSMSFPNSLGSDIASSWTFLEAISESLASSAKSQRRSDMRIEAVTDCWDVILRALTSLEQIARAEVGKVLQDVNEEIMSTFVKVPKGPQEQRTNQRNVYIRTPLALAHIPRLHYFCRLNIRRICYALRIPKVVTGTGFADGHWVDEARYLVSICGTKTQNFFMFHLLTAFLGNHTDWLEKLGVPCRKQQPYGNDHRSSSRSMSCRTVIVADKRALARRLVFLLASFLPTPAGDNAFEQYPVHTHSPMPISGLMGSSPASKALPRDVVNPTLGHRQRDQHVSFGAADPVELSTSASTTRSVAISSSYNYFGKGAQPSRHLARKDSDATSMRRSSILPITASSHSRKTSAVQSAATPHPATPIAHLTTVQDSYFPEQAAADGADSVASADLARLLRRDSSGSASSSTWGNLLGGVLGRKQDNIHHRQRSESSNTSGPPQYRQTNTARTASEDPTVPNKLESMVEEAASPASPKRSKEVAIGGIPLAAELQHPPKSTKSNAPRMKVDEDDGVIDVDMGLSGFIGWNAENKTQQPLHDQQASASMRSFEAAGSLHSSLSHVRATSRPRVSEGANVAGYLKRYHEDFILQSVRPYEDLLDEVKKSMSLEAKSVNTRDLLPERCGAETGDKNDTWLTLSSTLIADVSHFTIRRLLLQRKVEHDLPTASNSPPSPVRLTSSAANLQTEERFVDEPVSDFDVTLTEAIEGVLDTSPKTAGSLPSLSSSHRRTASVVTNDSSLATPPVSAASGTFDGQRYARADCRQVVAEALEEVVRSVDENIQRVQKGSTSEGQPFVPLQAHKNDCDTQNVLREGVKRWLLHAETRDVW